MKCPSVPRMNWRLSWPGRSSLDVRAISLFPCFLMCVLVCLAVPAGAFGDEDIEDKAIYNYKTWDCHISGNSYTLTLRYSLTIYNKRGDGYRGLSIRENDFVKLRSVSARVLDSGGREIYTRDKKDMSKACGYGSVSLYRDACTYYTVLESAQYPYTIEYEYTIESRSLFFWPGAQFQNYIPVEQASYSLTVPQGFKFHHKLYEIDIEPEIYESAGEVTYLWTARDISALDEIDYLPPGQNGGARIEFAADRFSLDTYGIDRCDWTSIGHWYSELARERYLGGGPTVPGGRSAAAAKALFSDVKGKTRYVSVSIGVGGWRPNSAEQTQARGYGDCKDMSTLLVSRLRQQGIQAYPALVLTRGEGLTDVDFPNFGFNHVITMAVIEDDTLWMDCTSDNCPFEDVPWSVEDVNALVVTDDGGRIMRIAASTAEDNRRLHTTRIHINEDRRMSLDVELQTFGNYAKYLRDLLESKDQDETRRFINRQFDGSEKKYRIESYEIHNLKELDEPVIISVRAVGIKPLRKIGATLYCGPFVLDEMYSFEKADLEERAFPLYLYYPELVQSSITITWDSSLAADSVDIPGSDSLIYPFGELHLASQRSGDTVHVDFIKTYHAYQLDVDQFTDFETFRDKNKNIIKRYVKLMHVSRE